MIGACRVVGRHPREAGGLAASGAAFGAGSGTEDTRPSRLIRHFTAVSRLCQRSGIRRRSGLRCGLRRRNSHGDHKRSPRRRTSGGEVAGRQAIMTHPRGRLVGEHQDLDEAEQQAVRQAVLDHRPCASGLAGQLWTRVGGGFDREAVTGAADRAGRGAVRLWWERLGLRSKHRRRPIPPQRHRTAHPALILARAQPGRWSTPNPNGAFDAHRDSSVDVHGDRGFPSRV